MRMFTAARSRSEYDHPILGDAPRRLRLRFCFAAVLILCVSVFVGRAVLTDFAQNSFGFLWQHYMWALAPVVALAAGLALNAYFKLLATSQSDAWLAVAALGGVLIAAITALEVDSEVDPLSRVLSALSIGWVGSLLFVALALIAPVVLRYEQLEYFNPFEAAAYLAVGAACLGPLYVAIRALYEFAPWSDIGEQVASKTPAYWPPVLLSCVAAALLVAYRNVVQRRRHGWVEETEREQQPQDRRAEAVLLVAVSLCVLVLVLYYLPTLLVADSLTAADRASAVTEERRTLLAVLGGLGAAVTLYYTYKRHELDRDANATGRYTEAVQQLGDQSMSIRLGGIYALGRVARDSPGDANTVIEVLAAFVRDSTRQLPTGVALDVMAALNELSKLPRPERGERINLRSTSMRAAHLDSVQFPRAVDLRNSDLTAANLRGASMRAANLNDAMLDDAILARARLRSASLVSASLVGADLSGVDLERGTLNDADLSGANLHSANLRGADLRGASLRGANLLRANLSGARLEGVDLRDSVLAEVNVGHAVLFDSGLDRVALEAVGARNVDEAIWDDVESETDGGYARSMEHERWLRRHVGDSDDHHWFGGHAEELDF